MKKIAIITGASAGLGQELARQSVRVFPEIEEYWLIARREDKLRETASLLPGKNLRLLSLDLCREESFLQLEEALAAEKPELSLLINNAGCGYLNLVGEGPLAEATRTIDLNLRALTAVSHLCLPYMQKGGRIINISSIASFCPNPRMTVYSASKFYVTAYSRGLHEELRPRGIKVTAVCSGPMDTEFIALGGIKGKSPMFDFLPFCKPEQVAGGALRAARRGRPVYTPRLFYKFYRLLAKLLPQALMVKFART
ncbi:MAG: SDR family NAD(P)-dependent oxidoreductase [Bacillota bacterium]|nr:SDR family NAD(P)-dependent oxidoreductase [Bacillota bacterium]